jgi:hypothetical protein
MTLRVLSLGAGVQSTTLALMAAKGEIEVDCAIFADTGAEPRAVYEHLAKLTEFLPFIVNIVKAGNLRDVVATDRFDPVPWYMDGSIGRRQCTKEFKIYPIRRRVREMLGGKTPRGGCEMLIGISTDEAQRMKESNVAYIRNRWPLIDLNMSRRACVDYMAAAGWSAPRSSCTFCPYKSDAEWRHQRDETPDEWAETVALSHELAARGEFMHRSLKPLVLAIGRDGKAIRRCALQILGL